MTNDDRDLGMDRAITRRDFLNGASIAVGGVLAPELMTSSAAAAQAGAVRSEDYPPARTGLRGAHPGSFEGAHQMRDGKAWEIADGEDTRETYDLIVVGAGMSGLSAAYYFRKKTTPNAKILILDNHDDFGGHAKRNEFTVDGRLLIAKGGTQFIERPATFTAEGRELLKEIGIDYNEPSYKHDTGFFGSKGLRAATYFDKESYGADRLVVNEVAQGGGGGGLQASPEFLAKTPLPAHVQQDLIRLSTDKRDYLAGMTPQQKIQKLKSTSYQDYLLNVVKVHPDVLNYFHPGGPAGLTTDTTNCWYFFARGNAGFAGLGLELPANAPSILDHNRPDQNEPTQFHFPEGNAGIARLIVRSLIPDAMPGKTMVDAELARVNYGALDSPQAPVRLRLSSIVVRVANVGDSTTASEADVVYVKNGKAHRVRGKSVVLACNNAVIPYLMPELPAKQRDALHLAVRGVNMRTQVALRNWKTFEKIGVATVTCPGLKYPGYDANTGLTAESAISLGQYRAPQRSEEPVILTLNGGVARIPGLPARDQFRAARAEMFNTTFETFERKLRRHLARVFASGGFDPAREIAGITINRWPHGYAMGQNLLFDPDWSDDEVPWVVGRKRFGRVAIANSDAGAVCLTNCAFDQAYRAVDDLDQRKMAWWNRI